MDDKDWHACNAPISDWEKGNVSQSKLEKDEKMKKVAIVAEHHVLYLLGEIGFYK